MKRSRFTEEQIVAILHCRQVRSSAMCSLL